LEIEKKTTVVETMTITDTNEDKTETHVTVTSEISVTTLKIDDSSSASDDASGFFVKRRDILAVR
jgi:hypothetical protein